MASRLANRIQLTSDGHRAYLEAVEGAFGGDIDYAMLVKMYGAAPEARNDTARLNASAHGKSGSKRPAIPIPSIFRPALPNATI